MVTLTKSTRVRAQFPDEHMTGIVLGPCRESGHVRVLWDVPLWVSNYPVKLLQVVVEDQP
jgi:hypothetical protein